MQFNVHLSQSYNKTLLIGNTTSDIPFDDTLSVSSHNLMDDRKFHRFIIIGGQF